MARTIHYRSRCHIIINNWLRMVLWTSLWAVGWRLVGLMDYKQVTWSAPGELLGSAAMKAAALVATATIAGILHKKFGSFHVYSWLVHPSHVLAVGAGAGLAYGASMLESGDPLFLLVAFMVTMALLAFTTSHLLGAPLTGYVPPTPPDSSSAYRLFEMGEPSQKALVLVEQAEAWIGRDEQPDRDPGDGTGSGELEAEQARLRRVETLLEWINNDDEVVSPENNRFPRHGVTAYHMAMGLYAWIVSFADLSDKDRKREGRTENLADFGDRYYSAALVGDPGTGKSSVLKLAEHHFRDFDALSFCYCEAGRFAEREALVVGILERLLTEVRRFGDVMPISQTPRQVWQEVGGGKLGLLASVMAMIPPTSLEERLGRLDQILIALDRFIVLCLEDFERFTPPPTDDSRQVGDFALLALLMHIDKMERVCLVVATTDWGIRLFDENKLIRRSERVPAVPLGDIASVVNELRNESLVEDGADGIVGVVGPKPFGGEQDQLGRGRFLEDCRADFGHPDAGFTAICKAIGSGPRRMKSVLRRHRELWGRLKGEVDHDDLLSLTALEFYCNSVYQLFVEHGVRIALEFEWLRADDAWESVLKGVGGEQAPMATVQEDGRFASVPSRAPGVLPQENANRPREEEARTFFVRLGGHVVQRIGEAEANGQIVLGLLHQLFVQEGTQVSELLPVSSHRICGFRPQAAFSPHPKYIERMAEKQQVMERRDTEALERAEAFFTDLERDKIDAGESGVGKVVGVVRGLGNLSVLYSRQQWEQALRWWVAAVSKLEVEWIKGEDLSCLPILRALLVKRGSDDPLNMPRKERKGEDNVDIDALMVEIVGGTLGSAPGPAVTGLISYLRYMADKNVVYHRLSDSVWAKWKGEYGEIEKNGLNKNARGRLLTVQDGIGAVLKRRSGEFSAKIVQEGTGTTLRLDHPGNASEDGEPSE